MKRIVFAVVILLFFVAVTVVHADQLDDITKQLEDVKNTFSQISSANQTNQATLDNLNKQLDSVKTKIGYLEQEIEKRQAELDQGEQELSHQKTLLNERAKSYYKNAGKNSISFLQLFLSDNLSASLQNFFYQKTIVDDDKRAILKIVAYIKDVEDKKKVLEDETNRLAVIKADVDKQSSFLAGEVAKANKYLGELKSKIAQLTAQQQSIIAARQAGLNLPKSAYTSQGGCSSDLTNGKDPGFSPGFGFFSFGVPHRVGLNQYGAKGRAESNKSAKEILEAYFNAEYKEGYDQGINIHVVGTNEYGQTFDDNWNIEEYLRHVYEMPTNWPMEALKAQAIAARSYALARTGNGGSAICPNQGCQVVKREENSDSWKQAVEQTKGIVLLNGGSPISAYFSSTAGGYTHDSSSDISSRPWTKNTQDGRNSYNSFDDVKNNGYDKDSPWFYCDWGARSEFGGTAWLKSEEVADIVNVILLVRADSSMSPHVGQPDKPTGDTWDPGKIKDELRKHQTPFNSISSVSVSADFGYGKTNNITFNGDAGSVNIDGAEFKNFFNVRAPANIQIVGPLYNVEKR